ncbi:MAG TPA: hypothetical protein VKQ73_05885 [Stellaceae bacterium]|nr:hypothetical protein [Stellaceae bacterium]
MRADEFLRQLEADPEWVARRDARERDRLEREERSRREQSTLLAELAATGISVADVWDLVNTAQPYPQALPVLLAHLSKPYSAGVLDGIARALAVKDARLIAWETLLTALRKGSLPKRAADGVMVAISAMARPADLETLIHVISNRAFGRQRAFLVRNLMRSKNPKAREALHNLRDDPDLKTEIDARLKRSKIAGSREAKP